MFGQSQFGQLIYAQQPGETEILYPSWKIQCKPDSQWDVKSPAVVTVTPCNKDN